MVSPPEAGRAPVLGHVNRHLALKRVSGSWRPLTTS